MAKSERLIDVGVSEREAEVLRLVGDHLSNAQIARRLFISVRTVESHVSSLLRKLDLTDRRGLADLATSLDQTTPDREGPASAGGAEADEAAAIAADAACPIRYTKRDDLNIAYQVTGAGDLDLVLVAGFVSHLMLDWTERRHAHFLHRLGTFSRLIRFDKRGTGMSDRPGALPDLETRVGDVVAVMDAARSERSVLFGYSEGAAHSCRI
jgi:DNA-binding CsgD family transcriptional regulator